MPPRRYKDGQRVCIYEEATPGAFYGTDDLPAAITNPTANLDKIYFHSSLPYLIKAYDRTVTINFPARNYPPGKAQWFFPDHNLGFMPYGVLLSGDTQIPTGEPIQGSTSAARHAALGFSNSRLWLRECWNYSSLPAFTMTFRAILYRLAPTNSVPHLAYEGPDYIAYGGGRFDTRNNFIKHAAVSPDFWMTKGRTIDTTYAGYRGVRPNGQVREFNTYTGSFAGSGFFGVAD